MNPPDLPPDQLIRAHALHAAVELNASRAPGATVGSLNPWVLADAARFEEYIRGEEPKLSP